MEKVAKEGYKENGAGEKPITVRYADDFVILYSDKAELQRVTERVTAWLADMGLQLSPKKTRLTHTLDTWEGNVGFDFLGFTLRQYRVGKTHTGKDPYRRPLGFKTLIRPSKEAIKRHTQEIRLKLRNASQEAVIGELNPIIRGWCNYHRWVACKKAFSTCEYNTFQQLLYWAKRLKQHPSVHNEKAKLLKRQQWHSPQCGLSFKEGDVLETDHHIPTVLGGKDEFNNKFVYHRHCHDEKTARDMALIARHPAAGINHN